MVEKFAVQKDCWKEEKAIKDWEDDDEVEAWAVGIEMMLNGSVSLDMFEGPSMTVGALVDGTFNMEVAKMVALVTSLIVVRIDRMKSDIAVCPSPAGLYLFNDGKLLSSERRGGDRRGGIGRWELVIEFLQVLIKVLYEVQHAKLEHGHEKHSLVFL